MRHATGSLDRSKTHKDRSWSFVAVDGGEFLGTLAVRQGKKDAQSYDVEENAIHGKTVREFILRKQRDEEVFYSVMLTPAGTTCTCIGFGRWKTCKHADAITEALADGVLDDEQRSLMAGYENWLERTANEEGPWDQEEPEPPMTAEERTIRKIYTATTWEK